MIASNAVRNNDIRSNINQMGQGFSAKQDSADRLLILPLPALRIGTWVIAVGCTGCTFSIGLNISRCGDGWMGFPSEEMHPSPAQQVSADIQKLQDLAGFNFTCVPVITTKVLAIAPTG